MNVTFYYQKTKPKHDYEVIITSFSIAVSKVLDLPDTVEVCLYKLGGNIYGGIDYHRINRIALDYDMPLMALPKILTHELIHVNQKHTGIFKTTRGGICYWHGVPYNTNSIDNLSYEEYLNLPWEMDVVHRQQQVFKKALELVDKK